MTKKTYVVTAPTGYDGHPEGEEFEADLDPFLEQQAIENDWIKAKGAKTTGKDGSNG